MQIKHLLKVLIRASFFQAELILIVAHSASANNKTLDRNNNEKLLFLKNLSVKGKLKSSSGHIILTAKKIDTVGGVVTDAASGQILPGVSVNIKNENIGTTTDRNGRYRVNISDNNAVLVFTIVGYLPQEISVKGRGNVDVKLKTDSKSLSEVVVVGYGTQKRSTVTGALSSVSGKLLNELPVSSIDGALQGRVAGLSVTNNGSPGNSPIIAIRGISSISFASAPLYVVDGFPTSDISGLDSKDVQSVDVLKDASSAAIYGSRATNGVIIITTKKGSNNGRTLVSFDSYAGIQNLTKKYDLLNTNQYIQYATALLGGAKNLPPRLQPANFNLPIYSGSNQTFAATNTNWQDAYFKKNAVLQQYNVSISGGNEVSKYYTSAGYFDQGGVAQGLSYNRMNYRINSEHKLSKVFTFGENLYTSQNTQHYDAVASNRTEITNVIRMPPYLPVYNSNNPGGFQGPIVSFDGTDPSNPVEQALIGSNTIGELKIFGTAYLDAKLLPWLKFNSTYGINYNNAFTQNYTPIFNDGGSLNSTVATVGNQRRIDATQLFTQQLTFDKTFGLNHVTATVVYETQGARSRVETSSGNQSSNLVKTLNGATNVAANNIFETNFIQSFLARVNYDYKGKYLLSASMRRDGLSVFAPNHKYENFPAVSVGWKLDQEDFLKNLSLISEFKLRGGYGVTGINGVLLGNYPYLQPVQSNQASYPFNNTIYIGNASYYNGLTNLDLSWEKTKQLNVGIDLGLLNNKITLVAEYFNRKTNNLILEVPTPTSFGFFGSGTLANVASMQNKGFEFQAGYHKREGEFKWDISALLSIIRNNVISLNSPNASITDGGDIDFGGGEPITNTVAGQPVQSFYGYVVQGIFQNQGEINNSATQTGAAPGDLKFKDLNGDKIINGEDRTFLGSYLPKFTYSLNYTASYKNFDLSIFFQGVNGNKIFNAEKIILEGMPRLFNSDVNVLNAWTPTNTNTNIPRAVNGDPNGNGRPSTRWIEDGSYLRLKNLSIGYNVPLSNLNTISKGVIRRLHIYLSSQNLLTFTKYTGLDPEIGSKNGTLTNGIDYGQYPSVRSFQVGIQAGF